MKEPKAQTNSLSQLMDVATIIDRELAENNGELTPEIEALLGLTETLQSEKVDQYDYVIKRIEAESAFLKERASEFTAAAKARSNAVERIKERIKSLMLLHDKAEVCGEYVRFVLSPTIPSLIIDSQEQLPAEFVQTVTTQKIDNAAIKKSLQDGMPVAGAHLQESFRLCAFTASSMKRVGGK